VAERGEQDGQAELPEIPAGIATSSNLDVSGATSAVATEDLETAARQLQQLSRETASAAAELAQLEPPSTPGVIYGDQARVDIEIAISQLREIARRAGLLEAVLLTAAQGYEVAERVVGSAVRGVGTTAAQWVGGRVPGWLLTSGVLVSAAGGLWAGIRAAGGLQGVMGRAFDGVPKANPVMKEFNHVVNNATTVSLFRSVAQGFGAAALGAAGAPPGAAHVFGVRTFGAGATGLITAGRSVGLLAETPVTLVRTVERSAGAPPSNYADRLERVPYFEEEKGEQVMIEKYTVPGEPDRFSVYVGGTVTFSPAATTEPWDMTSNLVNATTAESGSVASVRAAMAAAGIDEGSPVQFTGFSQGGGTAARLAASGLYDTQGLVTFGGPTGQVPIPDGFPSVLIEHADDPVPALGGEQDNGGAVLVRRDVFGGEIGDKRYAVPSHHIEYYLQTANLMDDSGSPQLDATIAELDSFTAGATLESSTEYRFERVR
jgi:hypothetical protein